MRLIDADALLDRIRNPYEQAQVARWVNEEPTIEPEQHWIPVTEQPPKIDVDVLVTEDRGKEKRMIVSGGYSIEYYPKGNKIVITMPQTFATLTNTTEMVSNRRTDITEIELTAILVAVRAMLERRG